MKLVWSVAWTSRLTHFKETDGRKHNTHLICTRLLFSPKRNEELPVILCRCRHDRRENIPTCV